MRHVRGSSFWSFLAVLIILAVLGYVYYPKLFGPSPQESVTKLKADFDTFNTALDNYRLDNGAYPTTDQGLQALIEQPTTDPIPQFWKEGGYLTVMPLDPWGQAYQYSNNFNVVRVYSYGPGGRNGNTQLDITNMDKLIEQAK